MIVAAAAAGPVFRDHGPGLVCGAIGLGVLAGYLPVLLLTCPEQFRLLTGLRKDLRR